MRQGHTVKQMAKILGCSPSFLYKKTKLLGIPLRKLQTQVTEEELTQHVTRLHSLYPNTGSEVCYAKESQIHYSASMSK